MRIVAIGGGEIGRPGTRIETLTIDRKLISLSGKKHPRLLFLPTASRDSEDYVKIIERYFGQRLGCSVETLLLWDHRPTAGQMRKKIRSADIIYVGGGNTLSMLTLWRRLGVDLMLKEAASKGAILAGISAGAICWFRYGHSDSHKTINPSASYIRIRGLDFVPPFVAPHFDKERARQASLRKMLNGTRQIAIGIENCAALVIFGKTCKVIASRPKASAYRCYWKAGMYFKEKLPAGRLFSLSQLVTPS